MAVMKLKLTILNSQWYGWKLHHLYTVFSEILVKCKWLNCEIANISKQLDLTLI